MATFQDTCNKCGNVVEIGEMVYDIYMGMTSWERRDMAELVEEYMEEEEKDSVIEDTLGDLRGVVGMEFADAITLLSINYYHLTQQEIELIISLAKRF